MMYKSVFLVVISILLAGCSKKPAQPAVIEREDVAPIGKLEGCSLYVKAVSGLEYAKGKLDVN